jgi:hypothetical protein
MGRGPGKQSTDYASGAEEAGKGEANASQPLKGKTEGDLGKYGINENRPARAATEPDKNFRDVAGGGSPGAVQAKKRRRGR